MVYRQVHLCARPPILSGIAESISLLKLFKADIGARSASKLGKSDKYMEDAHMMTPSEMPLLPLFIHGMILDVDGTLVLSNDAHAQAWSDAFQTMGYQFTFAQVRPLIGLGSDQLLPRLIPGLDPESDIGKSLARQRKTIFLEQYASQVQPAPGSRALILHLRARGVQLIVGNSAEPDELDVLLDRAQVRDLLPERTMASDVQATKSAPDIVQVALARLRFPAHQVALLGDSPPDVRAGMQSEIPVIALRCGGFVDDLLRGAYAIYDDPADLLSHFDEHTLGDGRLTTPDDVQRADDGGPSVVNDM